MCGRGARWCARADVIFDVPGMLRARHPLAVAGADVALPKAALPDDSVHRVTRSGAAADDADYSSGGLATSALSWDDTTVSALARQLGRWRELHVEIDPGVKIKEVNDPANRHGPSVEGTVQLLGKEANNIDEVQAGRYRVQTWSRAISRSVCRECQL
jgi:hypothetical protein